MGTKWGPPGANRAQVGPMLAPMNFVIWVNCCEDTPTKSICIMLVYILLTQTDGTYPPYNDIHRLDWQFEYMAFQHMSISSPLLPRPPNQSDC